MSQQQPPSGPGSRREVLNDARRRVERALMVSAAADELADAADAVLSGDDPGTDRLRRALDRYRAVSGL